MDKYGFEPTPKKKKIVRACRTFCSSLERRCEPPAVRVGSGGGRNGGRNGRTGGGPLFVARPGVETTGTDEATTHGNSGAVAWPQGRQALTRRDATRAVSLLACSRPCPSRGASRTPARGVCRVRTDGLCAAVLPLLCQPSRPH
jgi:hypothetical protein